MRPEELKDQLDELVLRYNRTSFIENDPILIPHRFEDPADIEISGFLSATIAWGQRSVIVSNASKLMSVMGNEPHRFVMEASESDLRDLHFVHRTFNGSDLQFIIYGLRNIYHKNNSLQSLFVPFENETDLFPAISRFREAILNERDPGRTGKHLANPAKGTAAKRIHMYLRWMVRRDDAGVDFGLWKDIPMSVLSCPLDVHTGNNARALGLLKRRQNDRKAVEELNTSLRIMDPEDPVRYDFALFGMGIDPLMKPTS